MHLQRLEISGFKSFPDRAELSFESGVTAIVGPNGCGKSNVVDAITWVLGEQSAKSLRGERMEDVIFSGSDARRPTPVAEVKLQFVGVAMTRESPSVGNGDFDGAEGPAEVNDNDRREEKASRFLNQPRDVEVARRLYRSGESEYLIDGTMCRLRDIQDLLMDAGVGIKAYAIIEQGKIGQILGARPTERRQLIEEAAGVTKYKARRRSAELKLEAAQQNLMRVDDVVFEVGRQRAALKRQAAKARRYRRLRDELRHWEVVVFAGRYRKLIQALGANSERIEDANAREVATTAQLAKQETQLEGLRSELFQSESRSTTALKTAHTKELEIGHLRKEIEFSNKQEIDLRAAVEEIKIELEDLEARLEPSILELSVRRKAVAGVSEELEVAKQRLTAEDTQTVRLQRAVEQLENDVDSARDEAFSAATKITALHHAVDQTRSGQERLSGEMSALDAETTDVNIGLQATEKLNLEVANKLEYALKLLAETRDVYANRESKLLNMRTSAGNLRDDLKPAEYRLAGMSARLSSLEEFDAARSGYADAVRMLLADETGRIRHFGSVADYVDVDRRYETAIEVCLGDLLQCVVVQGLEDVVTALSVVREDDAGRCGFLVLNELNADEKNGITPPIESLVSVVSVIRTTGDLADAVRRAIGEVWIAPTFEQAMVASRLTSTPIVTLDGDVVKGSCVVYGGSRKEALGILAAKREVKELHDSVELEHTKVERLGAELKDLDLKIAKEESALTTLTSDCHQQEKSVLGLELRHTHVTDERERLLRKRTLVLTERSRIVEELEVLERRETEALSSIVKIEEEQKEASKTLASGQRNLFETRQSVEVSSQRLADTKAAYAALNERTTAFGSEVERLEEASQEFKTRVESRIAERHKLEARLKKVQSSAVDNEGLLTRALKGFDVSSGEVSLAKRHADEFQAKCQTQETLLRDVNGALTEVRSEIAEFQVSRATIEADLANLAASCLDALQISLDEVEIQAREFETENITDVSIELGRDVDRDDVSPASDQEETEATELDEEDVSSGLPKSVGETPEDIVRKLSEKISKLGPINMMAVEQFDELEDRHNFLSEQRKDILEAIATTTEAVKRIDKVTRERFSEAFTAINSLFQGTFSTLFGGGRAELVLLDENDLLESGVDIVAQPPGKRLQSMQLLSGGEKALVAMSLMFAIFQYRPSPFCLLDEIDAPLDDANIGRFIEMLKGLQALTQFVLITHNRKTMEIADRLYGITMEEPGVSRLISMELS